MNTQTPSEQIKFINEAIKDRLDKKQPTFFSIELERQGAVTPLVTKEEGENFYDTVITYLSKYTLTALIVKLYNGKSHNVKEPFQTFRIIIKRTNELTGFGSVTNEEDIKITPIETVMTSEKFFLAMGEKDRQLMMLEFDKKTLLYENEELRKKNKKRKRYIEELENELGKNEKEKKSGLGNVSLGLVGANAIESFAKSSFGIGILKNVFGVKDDVLSGLLGTNIDLGATKTEETKSTASLITNTPEPQTQNTQAQGNEANKRAEILKVIVQFLESSNDKTLRLYYELFQYIGSDLDIIQQLVTQLKTFRENQQETIKQNIINKRNSNETISGSVNTGTETINDSS